LITREEVLKDHLCPEELESNLALLLDRINQVRAVYGAPMIVTSGFRDVADMERIYKGKLYPIHSKHLTCQAVDIYDPSGTLYAWCKSNESFLEKVGFWLENRKGHWQHFQIVPFGSYKNGGTIWFEP
jgi:hypothetical protein